MDREDALIELGIARPEREARSSYTDMVVDALVMAASGSGTASPFATAALEMAASRDGRGRWLLHRLPIRQLIRLFLPLSAGRSVEAEKSFST